MQDMDNMEAYCVFYVKIGILNQLEQSKIFLLTLDEMGILRPSVQHDFTGSISFISDSGDYLRYTSDDILSLEECPVYN